MKRLLLLPLTLIPWETFSSSMPTPISASWLHYACKEEASSEYARGFCEGVIDASYSSIQNWCVPEDITHGEVKDHIKTDLLKIKPTGAVTAIKFVSDSINSKWPCSGEPK
jgi:hypothetical protein